MLNAIDAAPPLLSQSMPVIIVSAVIFGSIFFSVVAATTAIAARNAVRNDLPKAIAGPVANFELNGMFTIGMGFAAPKVAER